MKQSGNTNSNLPRWIFPLVAGIFLILALGTAYLTYQVFFAEPDAQQVFPKYAQPKDMATAQLDQALQTSLQRHPEVLSYLMYRVGISDVTYSDDKKAAILWLALYDKETDTLVPAEPGLAIAQQNEDKSWSVTVQADDGYNDLLKQMPSTMIDDEIKTQYLSAPQALSKGTEPLRGYRLPWKKGVTKFLTGSIGHVLTYKSCASSCMYAFDFADGGNFPILAAKGGRVKYVVWKYPDNNHTNANYIILEDDTTSPTTYQVYFHLSQDSIPEALRVKGTWVNQGQFIGNVDNTGYSSGPHLHFHVHANATSYWGNSVDIVFEDVSVNGGRPRTCSEAKAFPSYGTQCMPKDKYTSDNGDSKPPTGVLTAPAANTVVTTSSVAINGYGSDESGVAKIQPMAKYDGTWRPAGQAISSAAFVADIDLCAAGIPDGPVTLGLNIWDNGGNRTTSPVAEVPIRKKFTCPVTPPACSPSANQAALYNNAKYQGYCQLIEMGDIADLNSLTDFGDNNLESIQLGSGVSSILFDDVNFAGRSQSLITSSDNLDALVIGGNHVSSLKLLQVLPPLANLQLNNVTGPNGAALTTNDSITLSWQPSVGALDYHAEIMGPDGYQAVQDWQKGISYSIGSLKAGTYQWAAYARNSAGEKSASGSFIVEPGKEVTSAPLASPYEASFSNDMPGWTATGLWKRTGFSLNAASQTGWIFGTDSDYSKDGSRVSGDLTSPPIYVGYAGQLLSFRYATATESTGPIWDQRLVQISVDNAAFQDLMQITSSPDSSALSESKPVDLSSYVGKNIRIRFHFDTFDALYNKGLGWAITAMRVSDDPAKVCTESVDDGSIEKAREIASGITINGQVCPTGDVDFFQFSVERKQPFSTSLNIMSAVENWQPSLTLISGDGKTILAEGKTSGKYSQISTTLPEAGKYYLKVGAQSTGKAAVPGIDYRLSLVQDTTPPSVKLTKPADGSVSLTLPITLAADASDGENPVSRVEFYIQPAGVSLDKAERISTDETILDGWTGAIPAEYTGKLDGSAIFARAFDQAGNHSDSQVIVLAGDGSIPVTHLDGLQAENGSTMISLTWTSVSKVPVDHFELQYQVNEGEWQAWAEPLAGSLRKTSFFAKNGTAYGFRIRAVTKNGAEEFASEAQVKTKVEAECIPDKYEPKDNLPSEATPLQSGSGQLHNLCGLKDEDWTSMLLQGGKSYTFTSQPTELSAGVALQLFDMTGQALTDEVSPDDLQSATKLDFQPETSATYILRARAANDNLAGTRSIYSLNYDQAAPFSPLPVVCGAILIPLLTALVKLFGRLKARVIP